MDTHSVDRRLIRRESGLASVEFLLASALGFLLLVAFLNLVVFQYGRGALQSALEQGVRVGSLNGDAGACEEKVNSVLGQLLAGRMSDGLRVECFAASGLISASASARFPSWTPLTSDFRFELTSRATIEPP